jgi:TusA-related sulfurtransferase
MTEQKADAVADITDVVCPMTFVKTKVALDALEDGQILELRLNGGEAMQNVPRSLKDEGHKVSEVKQVEDGSYVLKIIKGGLIN